MALTAKIVKILKTEKVQICKKIIMEMFYLVIVTVFLIVKAKKVPYLILMHKANYFDHLKLSLTLELIIVID